MSKKNPHKNVKPIAHEDEFKEERLAAQRSFTEEDRKSFWKNFNSAEPNKRREQRGAKEGAKGRNAKPSGQAFKAKGKGTVEKPAQEGKRSFRDIMDNAFRERFDKKEAAPEQEKAGRPAREFKPVSLPEPEMRAGKKSSPDRKWQEQPRGKKRTEREETRPQRNKQKDSFLAHFDNENPYEQAFDAKGNKGVRREQQQMGSLEVMPLNKYVAYCGVCSRRDAVEIIKSERITVNGNLIVEPGYKVQPEDKVQLDGKPLKVQKNLIYVLMNKPKGFITTTDDPKGRRTVMDILGDNIPERIFPVGRLDRNTTGLLLLTNDGDLAQQLAHPKFENRKIYQVTLDKALARTDFEKIIKGLELEDGVTEVDQLAYLDKKNEIGIEIHSGKNRIVRRIFEHLGYTVDKLDRVMYAGLTKKNLKRGQWRFLTKQEIINLKHLNKALRKSKAEA